MNVERGRLRTITIDASFPKQEEVPYSKAPRLRYLQFPFAKRHGRDMGKAHCHEVPFHPLQLFSSSLPVSLDNEPPES